MNKLEQDAKEILRAAIARGLRRYEIMRLYGIPASAVLAARNNEEQIGALNCRSIIRVEMARLRNIKEGRPPDDITDKDRYKGTRQYY